MFSLLVILRTKPQIGATAEEEPGGISWLQVQELL